MMNTKQVAITEQADAAAADIVRKKKAAGIPATKGGVISELILKAKNAPVLV